MDAKERENFWRTLCSLPGMDWKQEMDKLIAAIRYPKYLYRYRTVNVNNLEALRTNHLYFSSADW